MGMQDATGNWGGNLVLSTTTINTNSSNTTGQLTDRLTLQSNGTASFTGSVSLIDSSSTLTAAGNTVLGTTGANTLTVNAASTLVAPLTAKSDVTITAGNSLRALGSVTLGTDTSTAVTVNSPTTFAPAGTLSALGNATVGSSNANSLTVNANATFAGSATFSQAFQLYSNSSSPGSGVVLGFQRQNNGGALASGFTLGSILFSGFDGAAQGPTAQIRSVFMV